MERELPLSKKLSFEDVEVGDELPKLVKAPITQIPRLFSRSDHLARKDPVGIKREEFEAKRLLIVGGAAPNTYR